jgi:HPt (histidine-containing phosphotransfer) domain-containing protein
VSEYERAVAALRREFAGGLAARLDRLRTALTRLGEGVTPDALQDFHLPAHSLKGTAASYDAHELVPHATRLTALCRRWLDAAAAPRADLEEASRELDALEAAMERYQRRAAQDT